MKIVHISDLHIRNLKFHSEYRRVFDNLYEKLDQIKPDLVINTGDTAHTKTQISPEFVEMTSDMMKSISIRAPQIIMLGNHDLNLMNLDRQDAISPIVESINDPTIILIKKSGLFRWKDINFWAFSLADKDNFPTSIDWNKHPDSMNIGLFHGSIANCVTDTNWRISHVEYDLSIFDGLDYVMMGDIHKRQSFRDDRCTYAGSLIQQNFGEELEKGFLLWNIDSKDKFTTEFVELKGSRKYYTIRVDPDLKISDQKIEEGSRIRVSPTRELTLVEQKEIEKEIKKKYKPHDVITLSAANMGEKTALIDKKLVGIENIRDLAVQERLLRQYFEEMSLDDKVLNKIIELNKKHQIQVEQKEDVSRDVTWKINKIAWSNFFNYGENNVIDFEKLGGLIGIFAPNGSGKSNLLEVLLETCFDATTKGINKNIFLVNDNKTIATSVVDLTANDQNFVIERTIEKIKYGQKKFDEAKEWGKTTVNFYAIDEAGVKEQLVGTLRPETERNIKNRLGTFEDFMLTSLSAQWNPMDLIAVKETKRKEILYKFLGLDIFESKCLIAKDESREYNKRFEELEEDEIESKIKSLESKITSLSKKLKDNLENENECEKNIASIEEKIIELTSQKIKIERQIDSIAAFNKVNRLSSEIDAQKEKLEETIDKLSKIERDISKIDTLENNFNLELYESRCRELEKLDDEMSSVEREIERKNDSLEVNQKNVKTLKEVPCGKNYPGCKFLVNAFDSMKKIESLNDEISKLKLRLDEIAKKKIELRIFKDRLDLYNKFVSDREAMFDKRDNTKLRIENVKLKLDSIEQEKKDAEKDLEDYARAEEDIKKNSEIEKKISELKKIKTTSMKLHDSLQEEIAENNRSIGSEQGVLEKVYPLLATFEDTREWCSAYEHYTNAMGKDGIAYQIMTQKLPQINEEINKILSNAADFGVFIEHDNDEQSIRIFLQYGSYKSRLLELGGGAEKMLASIAIRAALINISNLPKTNMFVIDEGFGKLDAKNLESIERMFDYLKTVFEHVIVISHLDTLKDLVEDMIEITTDEEGYAHIEIGDV